MAVTGERKPIVGGDEDGDVTRLVHSLTAFKSHFTRTEASNERLVDYAPDSRLATNSSTAS